MSDDADDPSPRLAPLAPGECGDDVRQALGEAYSAEVAARFLSTAPDAIPFPNALATLMHHPKLAGPFLTYNNVLLNEPALDARSRELMVLRVAWRTQSEYEWLQHVRLALRIGITAAEITAIADGMNATRWAPLEADLLAATDQLLESYRIDDDTWGRLADQLDERQLVELVFVVGTYTGLAMAFKSLGLRPDAGLREAVPDSIPRLDE